MKKVVSKKFRICGGFTVIELLVAVAVLSIMLVLLLQMVSLASKTWRTGKARAEDFTLTRVVFGVMERDIHAMVLRRDLASFVDENGAPACIFYTRMPSPSQDRQLSLVGYRMNSDTTKPVLLRYDLGFSYGQNKEPLSPDFGAVKKLVDFSSATEQELAGGVLLLKIQFVDVAGDVTGSFIYDYDFPNAATNTKSIVLSLLMLDDAALQALEAQNKVPALLGVFNGNPDKNQTYASYWDKIVQDGTQLMGFPESARKGLRVVSRSVVLPVSVVQ